MSTDAGTPTPRTDAVAYRAYGHLTEQVDAGFARQLERELTALRTAHEAAEQELGETMKVLGKALYGDFTVGDVLSLAQSLAERYEAAQAEIAALRVNDARYKARRTAIFQMRLRTEIPGYRNWKPTTVEEFNAEYDAGCDKEISEQHARGKS